MASHPKPLPRAQKEDRIILVKEISELNDTLRQKEEEMLNFNSRHSGTESDIVEDIYWNLPEHEQELQEVDLLLIGKTGNGKSSLGNTIIGHDVFESSSSLNSVTKRVDYDIREWNGYKVKVFDGPGVADTQMDVHKATQTLLEAMSEAISLNPQGFHAFILVVKFGGRFTNEDRMTVETLKKIFGEHFFKKFCIIVMTHGDKFEEDVKTGFREWVNDQNNVIFTELLKECNNRIVLFDNKTQDKDKKKRQLITLFKLIESLKRQNCRYCDEHFSTALETRNALLVETQKDFIEIEIMDEVNLIQQRVKLILEGMKIEKSAPILKDLYQRAEVLHEKIVKYDKSTDVLKTLIEHVNSIKSTINDEIKLSENLAKETARLRKEREEQTILHAEELRRQREEFNNYYLDNKSQEKYMIEMLQKQVDEINERNKSWEEKENDLRQKAISEWRHQSQKASDKLKSLKKLKDKQTRTTEEKISKNIFERLKEILFHRKNTVLPEQVKK